MPSTTLTVPSTATVPYPGLPSGSFGQQPLSDPGAATTSGGSAAPTTGQIYPARRQ